MDISFIFTPIYSLGNLVGRIVADGYDDIGSCSAI